jgi:ABC-type branched-subunit amino acid transport system substrate-binding protein
VGTATPDVVFWGGDTETGGAALRIAMADLQHASTPLISWDGLLDGPGSQDGTYIQRTKANAVGTFISHSSLPLPRADFADHYRQVYGDDPGEYVAAGHACTEVIVSALRAIAAVGTTAGQLREAVRAHVTDPQYRYQTPSARSASTGTGTPFSSS